MDPTIVGAATAAALSFCTPGAGENMVNPGRVLDRFVRAYNAQDVAGMAGLFARDAIVANLGGPPLQNGAQLMAAYRDKLFPAEPNVRIFVTQRIVSGGTIAQMERITRAGGTMSAMTIYTVRGGCIVRMDLAPVPAGN
jgi:hypothetical protein